jgi:hypothetical protein
MSDGSRLSEFSPGIDENTAERIDALEEQDKVFMQAADIALGKVSALEKRIESLEENPGSGLPAVTTADNNKILQVVNGAWVVVALENSAVKTYIDDYINEALGGEY